MATVPLTTEARVFAAQLTRDLAARQATGAALLSPGAKTWQDAFRGFGLALSKTGSPVKAAKLFFSARARLVASQRDGTCFVNCFMSKSRSGFFEVFTYEVGKHPVTGHGNEGIAVNMRHCLLQRNGRIAISHGLPAAFVSWHALGRIRERSKADLFAANGIVSGCGIAGVLMRESSKHEGTEVYTAFEHLMCAGVLRFTTIKERRCGFYDVLTVLPRPEDEADKRWQQGCRVGGAVMGYVNATNADPEGWADAIPVLDARNFDYVSRTVSTASKKSLDESVARSP